MILGFFSILLLFYIRLGATPCNHCNPVALLCANYKFPLQSSAVIPTPPVSGHNGLGFPPQHNSGAVFFHFSTSHAGYTRTGNSSCPEENRNGKPIRRKCCARFSEKSPPLPKRVLGNQSGRVEGKRKFPSWCGAQIFSMTQF